MSTRTIKFLDSCLENEAPSSADPLQRDLLTFASVVVSFLLMSVIALDAIKFHAVPRQKIEQVSNYQIVPSKERMFSSDSDREGKASKAFLALILSAASHARD